MKKNQIWYNSCQFYHLVKANTVNNTENCTVWYPDVPTHIKHMCWISVLNGNLPPQQQTQGCAYINDCRSWLAIVTDHLRLRIGKQSLVFVFVFTNLRLHLTKMSWNYTPNLYLLKAERWTLVHHKVSCMSRQHLQNTDC